MRISDWSSDVCSSDLAMSATKGRSSGRVSMLIATLIAAGELKAGDISAARDAVATAGGTAGAAGWLDMGKAADLAISGLDRQAARAALEDLLPRVDVVVQTPGVRRRGLIIADMDSTMITIECIDELADYAGIKEQVAKVTEAAMRGELDFVGALDADRKSTRLTSSH